MGIGGGSLITSVAEGDVYSSLDDMNFVYPKSQAHTPLLLNKVFDLLRKCGLCYYKSSLSFLSNFIQFHNENPEWTNCVTSVRFSNFRVLPRWE